MKKLISFLLSFCVILCLCSCNRTSNDSSNISTEVEIQEIIIDETGNTNTVSQSNQNTTNSNNVNTTPSNSENKAQSTIDYDTVVEVDICDDILRGYLGAIGNKNQYYWLSTYSGSKYDYQKLSLDWYRDGSSIYTVHFSENKDFSNSFIVETVYSDLDNTVLIPGKTYYWKVTGNITADVLGGGKIQVKNAPVRFIKIDGAGNVRDMGGWKTESGKTVKYGMLYRGQNIDNITDEGIATIKQLGLKTEFDLRYEKQKNQKQGTGMNYVFLETSAQYDYIFPQVKPDLSNEVKINYKKIFELLSNSSNYPFYTHCSAGADRTGTYAFLLNGLLGVSYDDLTRDYELTSFSSSGKRWRGNGTGGTFAADDLEMQVTGNYVAWGKLYKGMMDYGAQNGCNTLQSSIEHWFINYIGVPQSQIDSFKNIMLG